MSIIKAYMLVCVTLMVLVSVSLDIIGIELLFPNTKEYIPYTADILYSPPIKYRDSVTWLNLLIGISCIVTGASIVCILIPGFLVKNLDVHLLYSHFGFSGCISIWYGVISDYVLNDTEKLGLINMCHTTLSIVGYIILLLTIFSSQFLYVKNRTDNQTDINLQEVVCTKN